jgi:cytochrome c-type biogenesis protein CcmF
MIPEIGHYSLILAFCLALTQSILPLWGSFKNKTAWIATAKPLSYGQFFFVSLSFLLLAYAFITNDFSVSYVANNSNTHLPLIYRFCATWGAHEGSLLLWELILCLWMFLVATFTRNVPADIRARVLAILAIISVGFLLFILMTSNPFGRILPDSPIEGRDLNPLLQDPGLAIHPPMLYMGYVGFAVAFSFATAALLSGQFNSNWARWSRPWTLLAWSFLTFGITLGSWWAYRVLGWGGWWFWDPVENASFLPWLSGTALIHSLLVAQKRETFKAWTILLAVMTFSLSLMGTFLVRSGVLVSVHAFAVDPARGAFMLYFIAAVVGGSLALYAWRGHTIQNSGIFQFWSRETMLLTNNVLLATCTLTVLLGTLYPLVIDGLGLGKLSVGPPYFNAVFLPLIIPVLFLMAIGPAIHWQNSKMHLVINRFKYTLLSALILSVLLPLIFTGTFSISVVLGLLLAFWVILATLQTNVQLNSPTKLKARRKGMLLAHLGFAITVIGVILSSAYSVQHDVRMQLNDDLQIGPYYVHFANVLPLVGPNFSGYQGEFLVSSRHNKNVLLKPELRLFQTQKMAMTKTAIHARPFDDLYIALAESLPNQAWSVRIYYKPFVRWIWAGGIVMMIGGLFAAFSRSKLSEKAA